MAVVALLLAAAVAAAVQRAVGVGYSLVLLPVALLALPDDQAVVCVLAVGVLLNGGLLLASRERPTLDRSTKVLLAAAPVGQLAALGALGALEGEALRLVAGLALLGGCLAAAAPPAWRPAPPGPAVCAGLGVVLGAIGALTGILGPFVALVLALTDPVGGDALRRRLWLAIAWLSATALTVAALVGAGDLTGAAAGAALAPALLVGAVAAVPLAVRLPAHAHRVAVLAIAASGALLLLAGA